MLRFLAIILLTLGMVGAFMFYANKNAPTAVPIKEKEAIPSEVEGISIAPVVGLPSRLIIPKLEVNADIEHVGLDEEKRMDVPQDDMNVAWYKLGGKPGDMGSAVLAGHFDTQEGSPAVFYKLSELSKGDEIQIQDENGNTQTFEVTEVRTYKDENFPIPLVFTQEDAKRLNLITCAGSFDESQKNYSDRTVAFSILREEL